MRHIAVLSLLPLVLLFAAREADSRPGASEKENPAPQNSLEAAVRGAMELPEACFRLEVLCPDEQIIRELQLLPTGVSIWNRHTQIRVPAAVRTELLGELLRQGFFDLESRYGGKEDPGRPEAALRITCRVAIEVDGLARSSVQLAEGRQSAKLAALANALLDRVQPLVVSGVTPDDLGDGLGKLITSELAPELLRLRWVSLPESSGDAPGAILRVGEAVLSRRPYAPGREIGEAAQRALEADQLQELARELGRIDFPGLPINLWSEDSMEIEVEVLGYRKTVLARPFSRLRTDRDEQAQARLEQLLESFRALESELSN